MINLKFLKMPMFAFFLIMIFVLICIIIYKILGPEPPGSWNYVPFPSMSPKDLPDANSSQKTCYTNLTACDGPGICSTCGQENFECVDVLTDTQYVLNNIKVPKGQWCLPKKLNQSCGTYTGKWVWSSGNCPSGTQCWKCECLYPDLYDGKDCMVQKACLNHSPHATIDQTNHILTGTTDGPYSGVKWDPNKVEDSSVLTVNPYTSTDDGKPWFKCHCSVNDDSTSYINLPDDPYTCHIDPCWEYSNYGQYGASCTGDDCSCTCNGGVLAPDGSKFKNRCVYDNIVCNGGHFDPTEKQCSCSQGTLVENCVSDNFLRVNTDPHLCQNDSDCRSGKCDQSTGFCKCKDSTNPLGSNCFNPCEGNECQNDSACYIDETQERKYRCECKMTTYTIQDCSHEHTNVYQKYTGINCENVKYTDGTVMTASGTANHDWPTCTISGLPKDWDSNKLNSGEYCVSGQIHTKSDYWPDSETYSVCGPG